MITIQLFLGLMGFLFINPNQPKTKLTPTTKKTLPFLQHMGERGKLYILPIHVTATCIHSFIKGRTARVLSLSLVFFCY